MRNCEAFQNYIIRIHKAEPNQQNNKILTFMIFLCVLKPGNWFQTINLIF